MYLIFILITLLLSVEYIKSYQGLYPSILVTSLFNQNKHHQLQGLLSSPTAHKPIHSIQFSTLTHSVRCTSRSSYENNNANHVRFHHLTRLSSIPVNREFAKTNNDSNSSSPNSPNMKIAVPVILATAAVIIYYTFHKYGGFDASAFLERTVTKIAELGPYGYLYFAAVYIAAELLAIPAFPLTASSGYLFGVLPGFFTVLFSATIAACISFFVGRTLLRSIVQKFAASSAKWRAVDKAIEKEGFKVVLLLRLSPLLPFALSNYLYGITSVDFLSFIAATFIGFAPGTFGIVYAGTAGKAIFSEGGSGMPWYVYLLALGGLLFVGQTITKIASEAIKNIELEEQKKSE